MNHSGRLRMIIGICLLGAQCWFIGAAVLLWGLSDFIPWVRRRR